jgi:acyl-CoA thioesterase FadM
MTTTTTPSTDLGRHTVTGLRPCHEGGNIRTWIGFKHFVYLAEEAVFDLHRARGEGLAARFHERAARLSVVESSVQLPAVLELDDAVDAEVSGGPERFSVRLSARRAGNPTVLRGTLTVAALPDAATARTVALARDDQRLPAGGDPPAVLAPPGSGSFVWTWRVPYYYCHYSRWLAHSGYVRSMEEVVDRFLAARGMSVGTMLSSRGWIPVVSRCRVKLLADVAMEETVHAVLTVTDVLRRMCFEARVDWYAERSGSLAHVATGQILHAYAVASGPAAGGLADLDDMVVAALWGSAPPPQGRPVP